MVVVVPVVVVPVIVIVGIMVVAVVSVGVRIVIVGVMSRSGRCRRVIVVVMWRGMIGAAASCGWS